MARSLVNLFSRQMAELEEFLSSERENLCIVSGEAGQGKTTLLKSLQHKYSNVAFIVSSFEEENSDFITNLVKDITSLIVKHEEIVGYRWRHILDESNVSMKALVEIDSRLKTLLSRKTEIIDDASDRVTMMRRAIKELFLLCSQNFPFSILWVVDSIEIANDQDLTFIIDILQDPRGSGIKSIITISTDDVRAQAKMRAFRHMHNKNVQLDLLDSDNAKKFVSELMPDIEAYDLDRIVQFSRGNVSALVSKSIGNIYLVHEGEERRFIETIQQYLNHIPNGLNIARAAALLGNRFYLSDLLGLYSLNKKDVKSALELLENHSLVEKYDDYYTFSTPESRSIVLSNATDIQIKRIRERIAWYLYDLKTRSEHAVKWGTIADHLCNGVESISAVFPKRDQIKIYLSAAEEAACFGDYNSTYLYTKSATELVNRMDWKYHRDVLLPLFKLGAKASYIVDDIDRMEVLTEALLENCEELSEEFFDIYQIKIEGYITKNLLDEAVSTAKFALQKLNFKLPERVGFFRVAVNVLAMLYTIRKTNISNLNFARDKSVQRIGRLITFLSYATYDKDDFFTAYTLSKGLIYSAKRGLTPETGFGLAFWSSGVIAGLLKNIPDAMKYVDIEMTVTNLTSPVYRSRIDFLYNAFIGFHVYPLKDNIAALTQDVDHCLNGGIIRFASYAAHVECFHEFDSDSPLDRIAANIDRHMQNLAGYSQQNPDIWIRILRQTISDLSQPAFNSNLENGQYFIYERDIDSNVHEYNQAAVFIAHHYTVIRCLLAGTPEEAGASIRLSYKYVRWVRGTYGEFLCLYANAMCLAYKSINRRLSFYEKARMRYTVFLFRRLAKQNSRVVLAKIPAIEFFWNFSRRKRKNSLEQLDKAISVAEGAGHTMDIILLSQFAADISDNDKAVKYLEKAIHFSEKWCAPAVENSLRLKLSKKIEDESYSIPETVEHNTTRYLIRCMNILNMRNSYESKCAQIAEELRLMTGSLTSQWIPITDESLFNTLENYYKDRIVFALNDRKVVFGNLNTRSQEVVVPVQTPSVDYGAFMLGLNAGSIISTSSLEAIKAICASLAHSISTNAILEKKKYESNINNSLYEKAAEGLLVATLDGEIRQVNKRFQEILGLDYLPEKIEYSLIEEVARLGDSEMVQLREFLRGKTDECQIRATTVRGKHILVSLKSDNKLMHCFISDITDTIIKSEQDETMLAQARYFASAIHEIRNPLNTLLGYSNLTVRKGITADQKDHYVKVINSSLSVLRDMFNDVISISAISEGRFPIKYSVFAVADVLEPVDMTYTQTAALRNILVNFTYDPEIHLFSDKDRISQVIRNLVSNAIKYSECHRIDISVKVIEKALNIVIADDGLGVPKSRLDRLFSPFIRGDEISEDGSGLGLFICKRIIEQLEGNISYRDGMPKGAEFIIELPGVVCEPDAEHTASIDVNAMANIPDSIKVFVIDDDPLNCHLIQKTLEFYNVESKAFANYNDALAFLDKNQDFDLIISDLHIGKHSGFDFIREARKKLDTRRCAYALATGDAKSEVQFMCTEEKIFYLSKPISESMLLDLVRESCSISIRFDSVKEADSKLQEAIQSKDKELCEICLRYINQHSDSEDVKSIAANIIRELDSNLSSPQLWQSLEIATKLISDSH